MRWWQQLSPRWLVSLAWVAPALLAVVNEIAQHRLRGQPPARLADLLFVSGDWLLYALLTPAVFVLSQRWPLTAHRWRRSALLHLGFSLLFCTAWAGGGVILRALLVPEALDGGPLLHFIAWSFITLPFGVAVYLAVVGVEHAFRSFAQVQARELQVAKLAEQLSSARYAALQAQLNPHFMFNTLNTVAVLIRDGDQPGAIQIIEQLSDILRRTLGRDRRDEISLGEELALVRQYLAIEQVRFSDRLRVEIRVDDSLLEAALPSFSLQHLAENAVRHGIAKRLAAGQLLIEARRDDATLVVAVRDDGPGIAPGRAEVAGHGLASMRERLQVLYGIAGSLVVVPAEGAGGTIATLRLPYRRITGEAHDAAR